MGTSGEMHYYNSFDQLTRRMVLTTYSANTLYTYNAQGIRTVKKTPDGLRTAFLLDGGNVVAEVQNNAVTQNYLRGINLILSGYTNCLEPLLCTVVFVKLEDS